MSDELRTLAESLFTKLEAHHFIPGAFTSTTELYLSRKDQPATYKSISASGKVENNEAFQGSLTEEEKGSVEIELKFGPSVGDVCPDLPVKVTATKEDRLLHFAEEDPKVYLIDFWATWCGPCQGPMEHNQEMLENNPGWEGKAEILAISLDDDTDAVIKRIDERGWQKVTSLWAGPEGFGEVAARKFDVNGIPTCALVHKSKVLWIGHPSERKLEEDINSLIEGKSIEVKIDAPAAAGAAQDYTPEAHNEMLTRASEKLTEFSSKYPNLKAPDVASVHTLKIEKGKDLVSTYTFYILGGFLSKHRAAGEEIVKELSEIFPNANNRVRFIETVTIVRGESCNLCNNALDASQVQYLCIFCEPAHYHCEACHNQEREGVASAKLAHPHHLYRIAPECEALDEIRFGKNMFNQNKIHETEPDRTHRGVGCDNRNDPATGCAGPVVGIRYKCVHCPDYDFCETCFGKWQNPPDPSMVETAKKMGHLKSHVWAVMHYPS
jgi:thiol-disulfide isomerase/thioredoxin